MQIGRWSKSRYGRSDVLFVTVCVDIRPKPVAREFQRTYFDKAGSSIINAFIEERNDYPNFPRSSDVKVCSCWIVKVT